MEQQRAYAFDERAKAMTKLSVARSEKRALEVQRVQSEAVAAELRDANVQAVARAEAALARVDESNASRDTAEEARRVALEQLMTARESLAATREAKDVLTRQLEDNRVTISRLQEHGVRMDEQRKEWSIERAALLEARHAAEEATREVERVAHVDERRLSEQVVALQSQQSRSEESCSRAEERLAASEAERRELETKLEAERRELETKLEAEREQLAAMCTQATSAAQARAEVHERLVQALAEQKQQAEALALLRDVCAFYGHSTSKCVTHHAVASASSADRASSNLPETLTADGAIHA